jgi:hypothetical protein
MLQQQMIKLPIHQRSRQNWHEAVHSTNSETALQHDLLIRISTAQKINLHQFDTCSGLART